MTNEATPRPLWEFDPENYGRTMDWGYGITQRVDEGAMIAPSTHVFIELGGDDDEAQDTGRELVKRWNAHDGMLAALRAVEWAAKGPISLARKNSCPQCHCVIREGHAIDPPCQLAAAIATATEGAPT